MGFFFPPEVSRLYSLEKEEVDPSVSPISLKNTQKGVWWGLGGVRAISGKSESEKGDLWGILL